MDRVLEPEVMDDPDQVLAYAQADFEKENQGFVDQFFTLYPDLESPFIVDLGCGPGDIPIRVAQRHATCRVTGIDASPPMIDHAKQVVQKAGFQDRIQFLCQRFQDVTLEVPADAIISNSLVHHVPNPLRFWYCLKTFVKPGGHVLVMDLLRPESPEAAQAIVEEQAISLGRAAGGAAASSWPSRPEVRRTHVRASSRNSSHASEICTVGLAASSLCFASRSTRAAESFRLSGQRAFAQPGRLRNARCPSEVRLFA